MTEIKDSLTITNFTSGYGSRYRNPVQAVATSNINLASNLISSSIDSSVLVSGSRILLTAQTTSTENGIYVVGTTNVRASDFELGDDVSYVIIPVTSGTAYGATEWQVKSSSPTSIVGTGSLNLVQKNYLNYTGGDLYIPNSGNTLGVLGKPQNFTSTLLMDNSGIPVWRPFNLANISPQVGHMLYYNGSSWTPIPYISQGIINFNSGGNIVTNAYFTHGAMNATLTRGQYIAGRPLTITRVSIRISVSPGSGNSRTFSLLKNGTIVASTTLPNLSISGVIEVNTSFTEFDNYAIFTSSGGTPAASVGFATIKYDTPFNQSY